MSAAIVAPVGARSVAMMRACLVSGPTDLDAERADRLRDPGRAVVRVAVFGLDLGLAIGSSEARATFFAAPAQPRSAKPPAGQDPEARHRRLKSPQQRSDQT